MLKSRIFTTIFMLLILLPIILYSSLTTFYIITCLVLICSSWEWAKLLNVKSNSLKLIYILIVALFLTIKIKGKILGYNYNLLIYIFANVFWIFIAPIFLIHRSLIVSIKWRLFLLIYGLFLFDAFKYSIVTARTYGATFVLSILLPVCLADIGAYFIGSKIGHHKLVFNISPNKTWEGLIGGILFSLFGTTIVYLLDSHSFTLYKLLVLNNNFTIVILKLIVLILFSVLGDLFESLLKRQVGLKNSSSILPGHGGILDRIDSILPVLPITIFFLLL